MKKIRQTRHGLSGTKIQAIYHQMKQRCFNPNNAAFKYYGERGITVCDRWKNSIEFFVQDMGHPPQGMTLDRIDTNKSYSPENCRWATRAQQMSNRRCNRFIEFNGKRQTAMEWSKDTGIPHQTIYQRIDLGWDIEKILDPNHQRDISGLALGGKANGERNKAKTHCPHGHEYTPENTRIEKNGGRSCRKCKAIREQQRRERRKHLSYSS